jgi:probable HAF family extracellular repeat protein
MKSRPLSGITAITLFAALAVPIQLAAQHSRYKLIDIGTVGGPNSIGLTGNPNAPQSLNNRGMVAVCSETTLANPNFPNFSPLLSPLSPDPLIVHTAKWQSGALVDLGSLPGNTSSCPDWISGNGLVVGPSENGAIDPLTGWPAIEAVLWRNGQPINLGTLGGNESFPISVNNRGQVAGAASNAALDPLALCCFFPLSGTQTRAFLWQNGVMQDLGTLGGPDAFAVIVNDRGQVLGLSWINSIPNASTGVPTQDGFLWEHGTMQDIRDALGGTVVNPFYLNNQGQAVGNAYLPGDQFQTRHPFLWDGGLFTDLGTLGGDGGDANWVNEVGEVVGTADLPGSQTHDGFLWKNGAMTDLGNFGLSSVAYSINSKGQIVGHSRLNDGTPHAYLWEKGGPMLDLNTLIPPTDLLLIDAFDINDRGEIAGEAVLSDGDFHAVLLIPCGKGEAGCDTAANSRVKATPSIPILTIRSLSNSSDRRLTYGEMLAAWRARLATQPTRH